MNKNIILYIYILFVSSYLKSNSIYYLVSCAWNGYLKIKIILFFKRFYATKNNKIAYSIKENIKCFDTDY